MNKDFIQIVLLFAFLLLYSVFSRFIRNIGIKTLEMLPSETIFVSQCRGSFIFEYEVQPIVVYDSIPIRVKEAFVEYECWRKNRDTHYFNIDSVYHMPWIVINFENDPWPGYIGDTVTMSTADYYINWSIYYDSIFLEKTRRLNFKLVNESVQIYPPDTLNLLVTEVTLRKDSVEVYSYGYRYRGRALVKEDTIGVLQFIRKEIR